MRLIAGNIVALIASVIMVYAGSLKEKKKILMAQIVEISMFIVSQLILGGITGAIMNGISAVGNILCYFDRLTLIPKILISIASIVFSVSFNNMGWIGLLPLICIVTYLWLMNLKNVVHFKLLTIFVLALWMIYDYTIQSYASVAFDSVTIVILIISIFRIHFAKKKGMQIEEKKIHMI